MPGRITDIHLNTGSGKPMTAVRSAAVIERTGLSGDRHAKRGSDRQILMIDRSVLEAFGLDAGQLRENLTVEGIELLKLERGHRLAIGDGLEFEAGEPCDPCSFVEGIRPGLREQMQGHRGVFLTPLGSGEIATGDPVRVIG